MIHWQVLTLCDLLKISSTTDHHSDVGCTTVEVVRERRYKVCSAFGGTRCAVHFATTSAGIKMLVQDYAISVELRSQGGNCGTSTDMHHKQCSSMVPHL